MTPAGEPQCAVGKGGERCVWRWCVYADQDSPMRGGRGADNNGTGAGRMGRYWSGDLAGREERMACSTPLLIAAVTMVAR